MALPLDAIEKKPRPNGEILKTEHAPRTQLLVSTRDNTCCICCIEFHWARRQRPLPYPTLPYPTLNAPKCSLPYPPLNDTTSSCQRTPPSGRRALDTGHWTLGAGHSTIAATRLRLPHTLLGHCADLFSKVGLGFRERRHPCPDLLQQGTTLPDPTLTGPALTLPCAVLRCPALPAPTLPCPALPCAALPYPTLP